MYESTHGMRNAYSANTNTVLKADCNLILKYFCCLKQNNLFKHDNIFYIKLWLT